MSINVTVRGNPVKIHRGTMIAGEAYSNEFDKRRKIRLQQVRQQSRDMAESVRNKVKKAKSSDPTSFEQHGAAKLKEWQNKKLIELQNQYEECLQDIGLGHLQALHEQEEEEEDAFLQEQINRQRALERGRIAKENLQIKRNEKNIQKAVSQQNKLFAREIENARANLVAKSAAEIKRKTPKKSKNMKNYSFDEVPVKHIATPDKNNKTNTRLSIPKSPPRKQPMPPPVATQKDLSLTKTTAKPGSSWQSKNDVLALSSDENGAKSPISSTKKSKLFEKESFSSALSVDLPPDTRISDRIKNRQFLMQQNKMPDIPEASSSSSDYISQMGSLQNVQSAQKVQTGFCSIPAGPSQEKRTKTASVSTNELPSHPTVSLKEPIDSEKCKEFKRVKCYDHNNKFSSSYLTDTSNVKKIQTDQLEFCKNAAEEDDEEELRRFCESERERLLKADARGREALERSKIRREYETLMKQLPILQRQDRMAKINPEKDKLHMSETRRKEFEKTRQQRIESAFEKLMPKAVTLMPKKKSPSKGNKIARSLVKSSNAKDSSRRRETTENKENNVSNSQENLRELLEKLKLQKRQLMMEAKDLPEDSNFYELIDDLDFVTKNGDNNDFTSEKNKSELKEHKQKRPTVKILKKVLILQNTSTQTSPKVTNNIGFQVNANEASPKFAKNEQSSQNLEKFVSCECKEESNEKLCEILIKIQQEDEAPKVVVAKATVEDSQKIEDSLMDSKIKPLSPTRKPQQKFDESKTWRTTLESSALGPGRDSTATSSTSYYSPPEYIQKSNRPISKQKSKQKVDPRILRSIKQLLELPKNKLDELTGLSTVSEVSTPSSSVVNVASNRPQSGKNEDTSKLKKVLQILNLSYDDLISSSSSSGSNGSSVQCIEQKRPLRNDQRSVGTVGVSSSAGTQTKLDESATDLQMAEQFSKWAEIYRERINNLAAMIDRVRMEKQQIVSSHSLSTNSNSDKENATSYLKLPNSSISTNTSPESVEQERLTSKLLDVKIGTDKILSTSVTQTVKSSDEVDKMLEQADGNRDLVMRYLNLLEVELRNQRGVEAVPSTSKASPKMPEVEKVEEEDLQVEEKLPNEEEEFTPMLDIPKLPKLTLPTAQTSFCSRKPPVSANALRFIDVVHELSAIPEAESSRLSKSPQKEGSKNVSNASDDVKTTSKSILKQKKPKTTDLKSPKSVKISPPAARLSYPQPVDAEAVVTQFGELSSSDSSTSGSQKDIEGMLKKIGLDWAIPTVRKSSNFRKQIDSTSGSTSSSGKNEKINVLVAENLSGDLESSTPGSNSLPGRQRSSTPIRNDTSNRSTKLISSGESELSPVNINNNNLGKSPNEKDDFNTLPAESDDSTN